MRAFIALELPEEFRDELAGLARLLSRELPGRYVPRENYHVTLAFLGELDEAGATAAVAALNEACEGRPPVTLRPNGLGKFGRGRDATLWLGLAPTSELEGLAAAVRERLLAHWLPFDEKPFRPHVTIARRARLARAELPGLPFPEEDEAACVTLFKSTLAPEGASYKPLHVVELGLS